MPAVFTRIAAALLIVLSIAVAPVHIAIADDVEHRIADFWGRIDALAPSDILSATDLGQWGSNVIQRDPSARVTVADFRSSTAQMQAAIEKAGRVVPPAAPNAAVEQRIAAFWQRIDAMRPDQPLSAGDLGQWALNVTERDPGARIAVAAFRSATAGMQGAIDRAASTLPPTVTPLPTPTPAPTPTAAACGTNVTDPSATGIEGMVTWAGLPAPGYRIELAKSSNDVFERFSPNLQVYGSATTGPDGRFRVTGAPVVAVLVRQIAPAGYDKAGKYIIRDEILCADRVRPPLDDRQLGTYLPGGIIKVWRQVTGLSVSEGSTVAAGRLTVSWDPLDRADSYCVEIGDSSVTWGDYVCGSGTTFVTQPLISGQRYAVSLLAKRDGRIIGQAFVRINVR